MLKLNKGDKVKYLGSFPFKLGNGQEVKNEGEELIIISYTLAQKEYFMLLDKEEKSLEQMNKDELLEFADKNKIDVDKRKGEKNIIAEIKAALKK